MHNQCKAACGLCDGVTGLINSITVTEPTRSQCVNNHEWCEFWGWLGECESNPFFMKRACKGACNPDCIDVNDPAFCTNDNADCELWSSEGECSKNRGYMMWKCKKSCHPACQKDSKPANKVNYQ